MNSDNYSGNENEDFEIMNSKEARNYCKEKLRISDTYYNDCVAPFLRSKFKPILRNTRRRGRPAHLVILKRDVEQFVQNQLKKLANG